MSVWTEYTQQTPKGTAGSLFDLTVHTVDSFRNSEDDGVLQPGMGVVNGENPGSDIAIPAAGKTADDFVGIAMFGGTNELDMKNKLVIPENYQVSVMRHGRAWVMLSADAQPIFGGAVYLIVSGAEAGRFTSGEADDGSTVAINARFLTEKDGNLAAVELFGTPAAAIVKPTTANDKVDVAIQSLSVGDKHVSDLISPDTTIHWNGNVGVVTGTINKMPETFGGSSGKGGHFFPFTVDKSYASKTMNVGNLKSGDTTVTIDPSDYTNVARLENLKTMYATYEIEGFAFALDFSKAVLGE